MSQAFGRALVVALALIGANAVYAQTAPVEPAPATPPSVEAPTTDRLSGVAARAAIAGNTLSGKIDGEENVIFFATDGRLTMLVDAEQTQGAWEMRGTMVCILVQNEDDECYELEVTGNTATLREDAFTSYRLAIARGNSKNLPLGAPRAR